MKIYQVPRWSGLLLLTILAVPTTVFGGKPDQVKIDAMKPLEFLVGTWSGSGWVARGPKSTHTFRGEEHVELRLGGTLLLTEGKHWSSDKSPETSMPVHHAMAVISPKSDGSYEFRSWLANRDGGVFSGRMVDDAFVWSITAPNRKIRYTIRLDKQGRWYEIGEIFNQSRQWHKFFEMTLSRQTP